jgi:hypothetical protein
MNELIPVFRESVLKPIGSTFIDVAEIGIDSVLNEGLFQEVPILKTLICAKNVFLNIRDRNFLKQTLVFIQALNKHELTVEQLQEHRSKLEKNPKWAEKELGRVMVLLDRMIENTKAKMLAAFYTAYIKQEISWEVFCDLSDVIDRMFSQDTSVLYVIESTQIKYETAAHVGDRLIAVGLVANPSRTIKTGDLIRPESALPLMLTELGKKFCHYCKQDMLDIRVC